MSHPFFSIIIPTFNSEKTIEICILSILNQTFKDYEILVIDASSTDKTLNLIDSLSKKYFSKIFVTSENDNGIYDAMNKGIKIANGEWFYFLGSDDTFYSSFILEEIHSKLMSLDCEILYGNILNAGSNEIYGSKFELNDFLYKNICQQAIFYNRNVFLKLKSFNQQYILFSDWEFNIRCWSRKDIPIQYLNKTIANYSSNGLSSKKIDYDFLRNRYDIILFNGICLLDSTTKKYLMKLSLDENKSKTIYIRYPLYYIYIILDFFYFSLKNIVKKLFKGV
jgi:glycosyltransferase involved in cell wall biosynthesis